MFCDCCRRSYIGFQRRDNPRKIPHWNNCAAVISNQFGCSPAVFKRNNRQSTCHRLVDHAGEGVGARRQQKQVRPHVHLLDFWGWWAKVNPPFQTHGCNLGFGKGCRDIMVTTHMTEPDKMRGFIGRILRQIEPRGRYKKVEALTNVHRTHAQNYKGL